MNVTHHADATADDWRQVCVRDVSVQRLANPLDGLSVDVRAIVHLGSISPAAVAVEARRELADGQSLARTLPHRMWSVHRLENGSYAFDAHLTAAELEPTARLTVTVWRARDAEPERTDALARRSVDLLPTSTAI